MTRDETKAIIAILRDAYPNFYKSLEKPDADRIINLWATMFVDDSPKIVTEAVKALICTLKFPPSIAEVKDKIALITQPESLTELEAWRLVRGAISYYSATENFQRLPPTIQKILGSPSQLREWAVMESDVVDSVIQSNFMRSFKARQAQEKEMSTLPESTKQLIGKLSERMVLPGGSDR